MSDSEKVFHQEHGEGSLIQDLGDTVIARFRSGIQECRKADLEFRVTVQSAISSKEFHDANRTLARAQSIIIQTVNQAWGVFSPSKIKLFPHQLWVCQKSLKIGRPVGSLQMM